MRKRVDELGRIVVPKEMREELGIKEGERVEIDVKGRKIEISKVKKRKIGEILEEFKKEVHSEEIEVSKVDIEYIDKYIEKMEREIRG